MIRAIALALMVLLATAPAAQTVKGKEATPDAGRSAQSHRIPAGADPGERGADPTAGRPAPNKPPRPAAEGRKADCQVRRADTDTGFVVVCREGG